MSCPAEETAMRRPLLRTLTAVALLTAATPANAQESEGMIIAHTAQ
jgi:hypothetical protein